MARTMTSTAAGRVNRRFLFLALILAALSAVLVYAAISDSGGGGSTAGDIRVVVAKEPIQAGTTLTGDMLTTRDLPSDAVGAGSLTNSDVAVGQQTFQFIAEGEPVLSSKLVGSDVRSGDAIIYIIPEGMRGMSINVNEVIAVGGLVLPGDRVDIYWLPDNPLTDSEGAMLLAENIEVLAVATTLVDIAPTASAGAGDDDGDEAAQDRVRSSDADLIPNAATMTLVLTSEQVARIFCAESGGSIRLAVRQFGDDSSTGLTPATCLVIADEETTQP